ncbi:hypothetical protein NEISICOT_01867 [Neisseria sicca ATCC 29256]|uniref:Uncharacterized protein n=1 Tax=Neisseria sicca ATCC 29256 TaxID=547045 RepID=C6M5R8_NEISI|nr:hypothetical protein NEISICOT_01867 [Neisseria sicca ATCC 29256]
MFGYACLHGYLNKLISVYPKSPNRKPADHPQPILFNTQPPQPTEPKNCQQSKPSYFKAVL